MFNKTKTEHHILKEFHKIILDIEKIKEIKRIIPGRIDRKQKKSSIKRIRISYPTLQGCKCIISKGSTAQELFIIHDNSNYQNIKSQIEQIGIKHGL